MKKIIFSVLAVATLISCNSSSNDKGNDSVSSTKQEIAEKNVEDDNVSEEYDIPEIMAPKLAISFDVKGGAGIKQFVKAIAPAIGDLLEDPDFCTLDEAHGYFDFFQEGDGSYKVNAAYWNRQDGTKMFIISYCEQQQLYAESKAEQKARTTHEECDNFYFDISFDEDGSGKYIDMGYAAFIYDEGEKKLIPMEENPINGISAGPNFLELPRNGKDIKVRTGLDGDWEYHTLTFDGFQFY